MVVLVSDIKRGAAAGGEYLHPTTKLRSKVELLSGPKHSMVEVEEPPTAREKGFEPAEMHEIYLCADRAAARTVGVRAVTIAGMRVTDKCHRNCVEDPTHRERLFPVDKPFVPALELIIPAVDGVGKGMAVSKRPVEPVGVFAVGVLLLFLCESWR